MEEFIFHLSKEVADWGGQSVIAAANYAPKKEPTHATVYTGFSFMQRSSTNGDLLNDVERLIEIIDAHEIECVLIHPFRCIYAAAVAASLKGVKACYVAHGMWSLSFPSTSFELLLFEACLAYSLDGIFAVSELLHGQIPPTKAFTAVVPQAIESIPPVSSPIRNKRWVLTSRLDEDKAGGIYSLLEMLPSRDIEHLDVFGEGVCEEALRDYVLKNPSLSSRVTFHGYSRDWLAYARRNSFGVIGLGRVAIEALAAGFPVILLSPDQAPCGLIDASNYESARACNFNAQLLPKINKGQLLSMLKDAYAFPERYDLSKMISRDYSAKAVLDLIERSPLVSKRINWSYFVEALKSDEEGLLFRSPVSFSALRKILIPLGASPLLKAIELDAVRDQDVTLLKNKLDDLTRCLEIERKERQEMFESIMNSTSWRVGRAVTALPRAVRDIANRP